MHRRHQAVLIQLRKPAGQRIYSGSFLRNLTEYFRGLAPIVETTLDNRRLRAKFHRTRRLLRTKFQQMAQSKITDFYSAMEEINQASDEIARALLGNGEMDDNDVKSENVDGDEL